MLKEFISESNYYASQGIPTYNNYDNTINWKNIIKYT